MDRKAQASLEYMVMLGISLVILGAIMFVVTSMMNSSVAQMGVNSAYRAVQCVREASDFIYVSGHPSKIKRTVYLPSNIENLTIQGKLVRIRVSVEDSYTDIYAVTRGNMSSSNLFVGNPTEGNYVILFESLPIATGYDVNITRAYY